MTVEAYATLAILIGLFGLLIKTKLPPAAIFMGALTLVITFRLAPLEECLRVAHIQRTNRAAAIITVAMIAIVTLGWMSMLNAALLATGAMLLSGCMTLKEAARRSCVKKGGVWSTNGLK